MEAYLLSLVRGFQRQGDRVTVHACAIDQALVKETGCTVRQIRPILPRKIREFRFLQLCDQLPLRQEYDLAIGMARTSSTHVAVCGGVHVETIRHIRRTALLRGVYDKFETYFERKMFHTVPHVMAHSASVAREILAHFQIDGAKVQVVYPPIDSTSFRFFDNQDRARARAALGVDDSRLTFLFVSCGHQRKGLQELMRAFASLDPQRYQLLVAGSKIAMPHPENVRHLGYCTNLAPVYAAVDYTILPSHYEPFGLVVPESMQCGSPVVVTKQVGAAELLQGEPSVLLDDNKPETIVDALRQLGRGLRVEPGFADRHGLGINHHINEIKRIFC
jgi:glycosyltransferase involved in cell wall biosynthesis